MKCKNRIWRWIFRDRGWETNCLFPTPSLIKIWSNRLRSSPPNMFQKPWKYHDHTMSHYRWAGLGSSKKHTNFYSSPIYWRKIFRKLVKITEKRAFLSFFRDFLNFRVLPSDHDARYGHDTFRAFETCQGWLDLKRFDHILITAGGGTGTKKTNRLPYPFCEKPPSFANRLQNMRFLWRKIKILFCFLRLEKKSFSKS